MMNWKNFEDHMASLSWVTCTNCRERVILSGSKPQGDQCSKCKKHQPFTAANNMDSLDVPEELSCLSPTEVQLIAAVQLVISVYS